MSQWWQAVGNTVSDLTNPRFELQTSLSRDERVTAQPSMGKSDLLIVMISIVGNNDQRCLIAAYSAFSTAIILETTPVEAVKFLLKI